MRIPFSDGDAESAEKQKFRSWEKQLEERKSRGGAAVEIGGDAHRVRLRGRRPAELEKGHQSKASENGAVTKDKRKTRAGKEVCTGKRKRQRWSKDRNEAIKDLTIVVKKASITWEQERET